MKKRMLFVYLLILASCTEKDSGTLPFGVNFHPVSNYQILKNGKWVMSASTVDPPVNGGKSDLLADLPVCYKDDTMMFYKYDKLVVHNGIDRCTVTEPEEQYSLWYMRGDDSVNINSEWHRIKHITSKELIMEKRQTINATDHIFTVTYVNREE